MVDAAPLKVAMAGAIEQGGQLLLPPALLAVVDALGLSPADKRLLLGALTAFGKVGVLSARRYVIACVCGGRRCWPQTDG